MHTIKSAQHRRYCSILLSSKLDFEQAIVRQAGLRTVWLRRLGTWLIYKVYEGLLVTASALRFWYICRC